MGFSRGPKIVTDGLVLALDAANTKSYPGSGTTWYDLSPSGYTFTTTSAPTFTTDSRGVSCFDFTNGNGEYFESTTNSPFSGNSFAISVMAVVNQNSTGNFHGILTQHEQDATDSMAFMSYNGKFGTDHWSPGGRRLTTSPGINSILSVAWTIPQWSLHQADTTKIYINGVSQTTEAYSEDTVGSLVSDKFRVGNWQLDRSDMDFDGQIYTILAYNRALTATEVLQNYNATKSRFGL
jgi:hypothetical protein